MHAVIRADQARRNARGTVTFEGGDHGSEVSFFHVNNDPGEGPDLHRHPYSETWIVRSGSARFTADGVDTDAGPGDVLVVGAETPHKFKNSGTGRLELICIHASPRMIQEELEE